MGGSRPEDALPPDDPRSDTVTPDSKTDSNQSGQPWTLANKQFA
jgi:hypothetical protein